MKAALTLAAILAVAVLASGLEAAEKPAAGGAKKPAVSKPAPPKVVPKKAAAPSLHKPSAAEPHPALLSGNKTDVELLSGNTPKLLSGNRASLLSGNSARMVSKVQVLSGITVRLNIVINKGGARAAKPAAAESLFDSLDRDGDGRLSPEEFRQARSDKATPASF